MTRLAVGIVQNESIPGRPERHLEQLRTAVEEHAGALDLLICPELFLCGYDLAQNLGALAEPVGGPFMAAVSALAARHGMAICYGYPEQAPEGLYNSAVLIDRQGAVAANHRKLHYAPGLEAELFRPGRSMTYASITGVRLALLICYDVEFPETVRVAALAGAELVVVPTALRREYAHVALSLVPTRAYENGLFVAYANRVGGSGATVSNGLSCIADPDGRDIARAGECAEVIRAVVDTTAIGKARAEVPFLRDRRFEIGPLDQSLSGQTGGAVRSSPAG